MGVMLNFIHRLFNYECKSCELLRDLLESERTEKARILQQLLEMNRPVVIKDEPEQETPKPLNTSNYTPWKVRREMLEAEDRKKAELLRAAEESAREATNKSNDDLEKELGVSNAS